MPTRRVLSPRVVRRVVAGLAVVLATLLVVGLGTGVALVRRPFPSTEGDVPLPGLDGRVTVMRDAHGVPQIYADSTDDLFRAQGYVHAQDRFFEMDWRRHVTAGRIAELVGDDPDAVAADRVVRTLGWRRVAEVELDRADPATRRYLEAYARGVNDYLRGRSASQLSLSYPILGLAHPMPAIEPWTPVDSLAWFKAMAWDLRGNYHDEIGRALAYAAVRNVARVDQLYPAYPYDRHRPILSADSSGADKVARAADPARGADSPAAPASSRSVSVPSQLVTVPSGSVTASSGSVTASSQLVSAQGNSVSLLDSAVQQAFARADETLASIPTGLGGGGSDGGGGIGSNSWVISGKHTETGKPLLANDPHLAPALPGVWYQVGLHCATVSSACPFDVAGFSFSGVPGIVIGHNGRIAWGLTNLGPDVTDLFLEKVASGDRVERDGALVPLTVRTETIKIAGAPDQAVTVRTGPHGPLLSDVVPRLAAVGQQAPASRTAPARGEGYAVALAWTALAPGHNLDSLFGINVADDFATFRAAALRMDAPAQNLVYADVDGHIGYQAPGRIPLRRGGASRPTVLTAPPLADGSPGRPQVVPTDGTWPLPGWTSAYDWKGYAATSDLPWVQDPAEGFLVAANQAVTPPGGRVTFTKAFDYGYRAQRIRDLLSERIAAGEKLTITDLAAVQTDTRNPMAAELVPLLLAVKLEDSFYTEAVRLLQGWNGDQPVDSAAAAYFNEVWAALLELTFDDELPEGSRPDGGDRWFEVVRRLLKRPNDPWWDSRGTPSIVETRDEILKQALIRARKRLTRTVGVDLSTWTWGQLHKLALIDEPLGASDRTTILHGLLNEGPIELPGGTSVVNANAWDVSRGDFRVTRAPSMRMLVDLGDPDRSRWVNQTGQSGHPGNGHYLDQLDAWSKGRTFTWPFSAGAVRASTEQTLVLSPAQES